MQERIEALEKYTVDLGNLFLDQSKAVLNCIEMIEKKLEALEISLREKDAHVENFADATAEYVEKNHAEVSMINKRLEILENAKFS